MKENPLIFSPRKVIQHIQHVQFGATLYAIDAKTLVLEWDNVEPHYKIGIREIKSALEAIEQFVGDEKVFLIVKTYVGISMQKEAVTFLQSEVPTLHLQAVAFILMNTTHRISINLYAKIHRPPIAIRGFMSDDLGLNWLRKQQS